MKSKYSVETRDICIADVVNRETVNAALLAVVERITEALHMLPECEHLSVWYHNIKDDRTNPDMTNVYFRIVSSESAVGEMEIPEIRRVGQAPSL